MTKKNEADEPMGIVATKRIINKSSSFGSYYANDVNVQTTPWDMRFVFGELAEPPDEKGTVTVNQVCELRVSVQLAKRLAMIMIDQLKTYEQRLGKIPQPPEA